MPRTQASWTTRLLILFLIGALSDATLLAAGQQPSSIDATHRDSSAIFTAPQFQFAPPQVQGDRKFLPDEFTSAEQRGRGRGGYGRGGGRNSAAGAEMVLGGIAAIAGTAILVYANRPDCNRNQVADGCGYGTKVVGGSFLAGGVVMFSVGALTWR